MIKLVNTILLCLILSEVVACVQAVELVKLCPAFKDTFLNACKKISSEQITQDIKFVKKHLELGGDLLFYDIVGNAVEQSVDLIDQGTQEGKEIVQELCLFRSQFDSDEMYDLSTGMVVESIVARGQGTKLFQVDFSESRCYKAIENAESKGRGAVVPSPYCAIPKNPSNYCVISNCPVVVEDQEGPQGPVSEQESK